MRGIWTVAATFAVLAALVTEGVAAPTPATETGPFCTVSGYQGESCKAEAAADSIVVYVSASQESNFAPERRAVSSVVIIKDQDGNELLNRQCVIACSYQVFASIRKGKRIYCSMSGPGLWTLLCGVS